MELAEFILQILIIMILCIGIFSIIIRSAEFRGTIISGEEKRLAVTLAQAALSAPCLAEEVNGEIRKGVFEIAKINAKKSDFESDKNKFCLVIPGTVSYDIIISDESGEILKFGDKITEGTEVEMPVAVKYSDIKIVPGNVKVRLKR